MQLQTRNLSFEQVYDPEVIRFTHLQNGLTWRPEFMTLDEYAERERIIGSSEISTKDKCQKMAERFPGASRYLGMKYFVLKDLSLPVTSKTSQIVSSCETLNRVGWSVTPESKGVIEPVLSVCIGGVFTIPEFRGQGYGAEMITKVNQLFDELSDTPGAPDLLKNIVIFLYSEVGEYYAKFGYGSRPAPLHTIEELDTVLKHYCRGQEERDSNRVVGLEGCDRLIALQKENFANSLKEIHLANPNAFVFTLEPSNAIFEWFHRRSLYQKKFLDPAGSANFGYALENGNHIIWHLNYWPHQRSLYVLKLHISDDTTDKEGDMQKLIAQAICEAKDNDVKYLQFWDTELGHQEWSKPLLTFLKKVEKPSNLYQENPSRSAIRIANVKNEDIIWDNNSKFCWF
ncbi:LANO_0F09978g1_1 [Lachancea nothofagi CBS 11611]|uniref:LANO_0F09978g1_1 n=1 Tax=Lachancea nothofagi CBS 11611 TaxID=1266666 RepID=A0A1G4KA45_9SACH|nr:LANO_0F09978g1_1 [Lachancea nothofagi CBS 11611]